MNIFQRRLNPQHLGDRDFDHADQDSDAPLRAHVRQLLLEYCMEHLTVDYLDWTETVVGNIIRTFRRVPESDPTSLLLPPDPWDSLRRILNVDDIQPYEEFLETDKKTIAYLREHAPLSKLSTKTKSDLAMLHDDFPAHVPTWRPETPVLTREARKGTPNIAASESRRVLPSATGDIGLCKLVKDHVPRAKLDINDALDLNLSLPSSHLSSIASQLKRATAPNSAHMNEYLQQSYLPPLPPRAESPELFTPLFPRSRRLGASSTAETTGLAVDIRNMLKKASVPDEVPSWKQNLKVVDGWETLTSSPPAPGSSSSSTTSSDADSEDEKVDQLAESPITSPPPSFKTMIGFEAPPPGKAKTVSFAPMDVPLIPRSRKPGAPVDGKAHKGAMISHNNFGTFLTSFIPSRNLTLGLPKDDPDALSTLGQASTLSRGLDPEHPLHELMAADLLHSEDPNTLILDEQLDEVNDALIPTPALLPPTSGSRDLILPATMKDLLFLPSQPHVAGPAAEGWKSNKWLKKAKGMQSLTLSLSWVPFTLPVNESLPNAVSFADVEGLFAEFRIKELEHDPSYNALLDMVQSFDSDDEAGQREWDLWEGFDRAFTGDQEAQRDMWGGEMVLTRAERRRSVRTVNGGSMGGAETQEKVTDGEGEQEGSLLGKKRKASLVLGSDNSGPGQWKKRHSRSTKDVDDSGIGFTDPAPPIASSPLPPSSPSSSLFRSSLSIPSRCPGRSSFQSSQSSPRRFAFLFSDADNDDGTIPQDLLLESESPPIRHYHVAQPQGTMAALSLPPLPCHPDEYKESLDLLYDGSQLPESQTFYPLSFPVDSQEGRLVYNLSPEDHEGLFATPQRRGRCQDNFTVPTTYADDQDPAFDFAAATTNASTSRAFYLPQAVLSFAPNDVQGDDEGPFTDDLAFTPQYAPLLARQSLGIDSFALLRDHRIQPPAPTAVPDPNVPPRDYVEPPTEPKIHKESLYDSNTLVLPMASSPQIPSNVHRYLTSLSLLRRRSLIHALRSYNIDLVERDSLNGIDLILDPFTSIVFVPLFTLPSKVSEVLENLVAVSWSYDRILVIFEGYPEKFTTKSPLNNSTFTSTALDSRPYPYTPPIVKAIRKLRRDVAIAEAAGKRDSKCRVFWAFVDEVKQAAEAVRMFGDMAEAYACKERRIGEALWKGERVWLDSEIPEDEEDLAALPGMNHFAAFIILSQVDPQTFIEMKLPARVDMFGAQVGLERMQTLNGLLRGREDVPSEMDPRDASANQAEKWGDHDR